jgi:hypothetical protein
MNSGRTAALSVALASGLLVALPARAWALAAAIGCESCGCHARVRLGAGIALFVLAGVAAHRFFARR